MIATLERVGAIKSDLGRWLFPSLADPTIVFWLYVGHEEDSKRQGLSWTIEEHVYDLEAVDTLPEVLARGLGISPGAAHKLITDAHVLIEVWTQDKVAGCETLPRIVRSILEVHDGIMCGDSSVWTSEQIRAGRTQGLESRPVPSIEEEYERCDAVFVGEVVAERPVPQSENYLSGVMFTLKVDELLRGSVPRTTAVFSEHSPRYFPMAVGKKYLLFVSHVFGRATVDHCGNSCSVLAAPEPLAVVRRLLQKLNETRR